MVKIKGLVERLPKKTLKEIYRTLLKMFSEKHLINRKKDAIFAEFKRRKALFESNLVPEATGGNKWGEKDAKQILKERNDRVFELEGIVDNLKCELYNHESKKMKVEDSNTEIVIKQVIDLNYYEKEISSLKDNLTKVTKSLEFVKLESQSEINTLKANNEFIKKEYHHLKSKYESDQTFLSFSKVSTELSDRLKELERMKNAVSELEKMNYENMVNIKMLEEEKMMLKGHIEICEDKIKNSKVLQIDEMKLDNSVILMELKSISKAFETLQFENKELVEKISEKNQKNNSLNKKMAIFANEKKFLERKEKTLEKQEELLNQAKESLALETKTFEEVGEEGREKLNDALKKINQMSSELRKMEHSLTVVKGELKRYNTAYLSEAEKNREVIMDSQKKQLEIVRLVSQIESYKSVITNKDILEDIEHLEGIRQILNCNLCNDNFRDTVILKCGHCYCEKCINNRIKSRIRGCPTCAIEFVKDDLMRIYFPH